MGECFCFIQIHLARGRLAVAACDRKRPPLTQPRGNLKMSVLLRSSQALMLWIWLVLRSVRVRRADSGNSHLACSDMYWILCCSIDDGSIALLDLVLLGHVFALLAIGRPKYFCRIEYCWENCIRRFRQTAAARHSKVSPDRRGKKETVKLVFFDESLRDTKTFEEPPEDRCSFEASSLDKSWMDAKILYVVLLGYT